MKMLLEDLMKKFDLSVDTGASLENATDSPRPIDLDELVKKDGYIAERIEHIRKSSEITEALGWVTANGEVSELWITNSNNPDHQDSLYTRILPRDIVSDRTYKKQKRDLDLLAMVVEQIAKNFSVDLVFGFWRGNLASIMMIEDEDFNDDDEYADEYEDFVKEQFMKLCIFVASSFANRDLLDKEQVQVDAGFIAETYLEGLYEDIAEFLEIPVQIVMLELLDQEACTHWIHTSPPTTFNCFVRCPNCSNDADLADELYLKSGLNMIEAGDPADLGMYQCSTCSIILEASERCN